MVTKIVTRASYNSRKTTEQVCHSTPCILRSAGSLLVLNSLNVNSKSFCRFGLLERKRCDSLMSEFRFLTS